jgi:hypothetical protein
LNTFFPKTPKKNAIVHAMFLRNHTLLSSPLQGFIDYKFRNAFNHFFGKIDTFYAPYIRLNGKLVIKNSYQKDIALENNKELAVIP